MPLVPTCSWGAENIRLPEALMQLKQCVGFYTSREFRLTFQSLAASPRLALPSLAQVSIKPAAEPVLLVPVALPVANKHQLVGSHVSGLAEMPPE